MTWIIKEHPGSDTDTNAAITGALFGAYLGYDHLYALNELQTENGFGEYTLLNI